jgi:hypothetical protein
MDSSNYCRACVIRYAPNAKLFRVMEADEHSRLVFLAFETLYAILCEGDSREYYTDSEACVFKLDNASAFTVDTLTIQWFDGDSEAYVFLSDVTNKLRNIYNSYLKFQFETLKKNFGKPSEESFTENIRRFAGFDENVLNEACEVSIKQALLFRACFVILVTRGLVKRRNLLHRYGF